MSTPDPDGNTLNIKERIKSRCFPYGAVATCVNPLCDEQQILNPDDVVKCLGSGWPRCHESAMNIEARGPLL